MTGTHDNTACCAYKVITPMDTFEFPEAIKSINDRLQRRGEGEGHVWRLTCGGEHRRCVSAIIDDINDEQQREEEISVYLYVCERESAYVYVCVRVIFQPSSSKAPEAQELLQI